MNFVENQYHSYLLERLKHERETGRFCDLVLHVDGEDINAHRLILAAASPYFDSIFNTTTVSKERLTINACSSAALKTVIAYIYTGTILINNDNVQELLRLANHFLLFKLKLRCAQYLNSHLEMKNCLLIREISDKYGLPEVHQNVAQFIMNHMDDLPKQSSFLNLTLAELESLLGDKLLEYQRDIAMIKLITRWIDQNPTDRLSHLRCLLEFVSWKDVNPDQFYDLLQNDSFYHRYPLGSYIALESAKDHQQDLILSICKSLHRSLKGVYSTHRPSSRNFAENTFEALVANFQRASNATAYNNWQSTALALAKWYQTRDKLQKSAQHITHAPISDTNSDLPVQQFEESTVLEKTDSLVLHGEDVDAEGQQYQCQRNDITKETHTCDRCAYITDSLQQLDKHKKEVHSTELIYRCVFCTFTCRWNQEYYQHIQKIHFKGDKVFTCDICKQYKTYLIQRLLAHRKQHLDEKVHRCNFCEYRCRLQSNMEAHLRTHIDKKHNAAEYNRRASVANLLKQQRLSDIAKNGSPTMAADHRRQNVSHILRCQFLSCPFLTMKKHQLESHMRTHIAVRSHICPQCGRAFIEKSHLVRHQRIHLQEKPFKCEQCEYSSSRRDKLKEHALKHHQNKRALTADSTENDGQPNAI